MYTILGLGREGVSRWCVISGIECPENWWGPDICQRERVVIWVGGCPVAGFTVGRRVPACVNRQGSEYW